MDDPENAGQKQSGRFRPGVSGNPSGKPKGTRHKVTQLAEKLMQDDAENIVSAVLMAARNGDMTAARLVLDRIIPARRDNPVSFALPEIASAAEAASTLGAILNAVANGELTPSEADQISKLVDIYVRALEANDFEVRLKAIEKKGRQ
jgi:hypothetical protein